MGFHRWILTSVLFLLGGKCTAQGVGLTETKLDCPVFKPGNHVRWSYVKLYGESYKNIAALNSSSGAYYSDFNHAFKGRLNISASDGSLFITKTTTEDAGFYMCQSETDPEDHRTPLYHKVQLQVLHCQCVGLAKTKLDCPVFKPGNHVRWSYVKLYGKSYKNIAALNSSSGAYYSDFNHAFKGRLIISASDGSLCITKTTTEDAGFYMCQSETDPEDHRTPLYHKVQLQVLPCQCSTLPTAVPATGQSSTEPTNDTKGMDHGNSNEHPEGASNIEEWKIALSVLGPIVLIVIVIALYIFKKKTLCMRESTKAPSLRTSRTFQDEDQL